MRILTSVEAQNRFGELLDSAQREQTVADFAAFFAAADARLQPDAHDLAEAELCALTTTPV